MIHFPSTLQSSAALPRRSDSIQLNATQQKSPSHKIFLTIEEELHDARRVHSHGQEEDLRLALNMVIERLSQLSTLLSEAYKTNADLEVQLNVTKSNLKLVISNNEMLEDVLKQRDSGTAQSVGWRRTSTRRSTDDPQLQSRNSGEQTPITVESPTNTPTGQESNRFFKFRFTSSSPNPSASSSRPGTPQVPHHLNSPSLPVLPLPPNKEKEQLEELEKELEKEKKAAEKAKKEKEALEAELESLSQALFEEANKMVAAERIRCADLQEELSSALDEKQALRSALMLLEGENTNLRSESSSPKASFHTPLSNTPVSMSPAASNDTRNGASSPSPASTKAVEDPFSSEDARPSPKRSPSSSLLPSLSSLPKRSTPPPPAPLEIPTTPFVYSAGINGSDASDLQDTDMTTPRRVTKSLEQDVEADDTREAPQVQAIESKEEQDTVTTAKNTEPGLSRTPDSSIYVESEPRAVDPPMPTRAEEADIEDKLEDRAKGAPPNHLRPLNLFPHTDEPDPWAGATSASTPTVGKDKHEGGVFGETV